MIFALDYLNRMERTYPGVLAMMQRSKDPESIMAGKGVSPDVYAGMLALMRWRQDKVIYNFEGSVAREIMEQTDDPDRSFPISCMRQLPYPCIAAHTTPISIMDPASQKVLEEYTGNVFLWLEGDVLHTCWQFQGDQYLHASMMLKDGMTIDDCFESIVVENLKRHFSAAEITEIKQVFGVERLSDLTNLSTEAFHALEKRFRSRVQDISHSIQLANVQEVLMQRALHIILYLACDNADIEAAEEKLKAGAWATSIGGEPREVKRNERRQALRETERVRVQDVGYRIAGKYKKGLASEHGKSSGTGTARGYGKRRAHFHHFWIGPRDGAIVADIMNPKPGERGLRLRWIEATEIHPELRDENATVVDVERL